MVSRMNKKIKAALILAAMILVPISIISLIAINETIRTIVGSIMVLAIIALICFIIVMFTYELYKDILLYISDNE